MRKIYFTVFGLILIFIIACIYFYSITFRQQTEFQKDFLLKQTQLCGYEIEQTGIEFSSDLNKILFSEDISQFFENDEIKSRSILDIELFYEKYNELITGIELYDRKGNVFYDYKNSKGNFIRDEFVAQKQGEIFIHEKHVKENQTHKLIVPIFKQENVSGNFIVKVDYREFIKKVFEKSYLKDVQWQWLINKDGEVVFNNLGVENYEVSQLSRIMNNLIDGLQGAQRHKINLDGNLVEVISAYYPARILNMEYGVVFSLKTDYILKEFVKNFFILGLLTFVLFTALVIVFIVTIHKIKSEKLNKKEDSFNNLTELLPVGVLITDKYNKIRKTNKRAREMFPLENDQDLVGKDISDRFIVGENFLDRDNFGSSLDVSFFYTYTKNNIVVYREDIPVNIEGEDLILQVYFDVTALEEARKQETRASQAKSDFLLKMSHEIRNPLNAIIGLTDTIKKQGLYKKHKEIIKIITKSADLLNSLISDLLDFSRMEADKIIFEEAPFYLRKEIDMALEPLISKAKDKKLEFITNIDEKVPDNLIGDPFRLRQVLFNLVDNAVKFTSNGKIVFKVLLDNKINNKLKINFTVEDTGRGIDKQKIANIFNLYDQKVKTTSEKFEGPGIGLTISKQLVELMSGVINVESPSKISEDPDNPGTTISFTAKFFSNEIPEKGFTKGGKSGSDHLKAIVIGKNSDSVNHFTHLTDVLNKFEVSSYFSTYRETKTIEKLKKNIKKSGNYSQIIFIIDTPVFNGFKVARELNRNGLIDYFLVIILSSNDEKGNLIKAKKLGVDYYIIDPFLKSEIFNILQINFPKIDTDKMEKEVDREINELQILVAEDNIINQKVVKILFKNLGYEIDIASNGNEAIEKTGEKKYDMIFMDIMMPEMDGLEATRRIRKKGLEIPIIALSADLGEKTKKIAFKAGINDFIGKPVKSDELKNILVKQFKKGEEE